MSPTRGEEPKGSCYSPVLASVIQFPSTQATSVVEEDGLKPL